MNRSDADSAPLFPSSSSGLAQAAIALGSNLGDSLTILNGAIAALGRIPGVQVLAQSHWYETTPVGPPQPNYCNGCALVAVMLPPELLLQTLLTIEQAFGRVRAERWGPRTLDLDLIFYDQQVYQTATLTLPHPRMGERAFVLLPLAEIAPQWCDPVTGKTVVELVNTVDWNGITGLLAP